MRDSTQDTRVIVGVIPAAGQGTRIAPLPCSKEVYPIGYQPAESGNGVRPKAVSQYLLEKMCRAGIRTAYVILRDGKWDIPRYFGDGAPVGMHLGYLMMGRPFGTPYTLDQAFPFVGQAIVAFGFPDILFEGEEAFSRLLECQAATGADVVLGLFRVDRPETMDMVECDIDGAVRAIHIKPAVTSLEYGWILAVWKPSFTEFLHEHLGLSWHSGQVVVGDVVTEAPELSVGHVFQAALKHGLRFHSVCFTDQAYVDIGTPLGLEQALKDPRFTGMATGSR